MGLQIVFQLNVLVIDYRDKINFLFIILFDSDSMELSYLSDITYFDD
jgi:hypothetical protein